MATTSPRKGTETIDHVQQHAERALELGRRAAVASIDVYERTWTAVADAQEQLAGHARVDLVADGARAQARYTRETARFSAEIARGLVR